MMGESILIVGGSRSGKSDFAQDLAEQKYSDTKYYVATSPVFGEADAEMAERVFKHQQRRQGKGWHTVEEEQALCPALKKIPEDALVLVDCMTLWVSNLLCRQEKPAVTENDVEGLVKELLDYCHERSADTLLVTGEVGCGIVPENKLARSFRDLVGRCNQTAARYADRVWLVNCGIPTLIKGKTK